MLSKEASSIFLQGIDLTYVDVQEAIERVIPNAFETNKVVSILFENLNVKLGTRNMKNR